MKKETWNNIKNYEGLYEVSNTGRVRSVKRSITHKNGKIRVYPSKEKSTEINNCGYPRTGLSKDGKQIKYFIHRIVAEAFIPNPDNLKQVNHKDGNKLNNDVSNLEWVSQVRNIQHSIDIGLRKVTGSDNSQSKLTEVDVVRIKRMIILGETLTRISELYEVSVSVISRIKLGKSWKHVND